MQNWEYLYVIYIFLLIRHTIYNNIPALVNIFIYLLSIDSLYLLLINYTDIYILLDYKYLNISNNINFIF